MRFLTRSERPSSNPNAESSSHDLIKDDRGAPRQTLPGTGSQLEVNSGLSARAVVDPSAAEALQSLVTDTDARSVTVSPAIPVAIITALGDHVRCLFLRVHELYLFRLVLAH